MAYSTVWYYSDIPKEIVEIIEKDLKVFEPEMETSLLTEGNIDKSKRDSENAWIPSEHWITGFIWNYVQRANRENFLYDLRCLDGESMQYTRYKKGQFYGWHTDSDLSLLKQPEILCDQRDVINQNTELIRKLSFVFQLSDPDDYEGGNIQVVNDEQKNVIMPRQRGTLILFDSRIQHRVQKVRSGVRKSIVGWVNGPRWK